MSTCFRRRVDRILQSEDIGMGVLAFICQTPSRLSFVLVQSRNGWLLLLDVSHPPLFYPAFEVSSLLLLLVIQLHPRGHISSQIW